MESEKKQLARSLGALIRILNDDISVDNLDDIEKAELRLAERIYAECTWD